MKTKLLLLKVVPLLSLLLTSCNTSASVESVSSKSSEVSSMESSSQQPESHSSESSSLESESSSLASEISSEVSSEAPISSDSEILSSDSESSIIESSELESSEIDSSIIESSEIESSSESSVISPSSSKESSSIAPSSSETMHIWSEEWTYDETSHWHACRIPGCNEKKDVTKHAFGQAIATNLGTYLKDDRYKHSTIHMKTCTCGYEVMEDADILPRLYFNYDKNDPNANFATIATSKDIDRPTVSGTLTLNNCASDYAFSGVSAEMKVRGNQTAGFPKKGLRIKFNAAQSFLGLNGGKKFKKWVLLADAKDSCAIRTALGLSVSKGICEGEDVFVSDFTPVSVYLNNEYWGYYYLAEQKETKPGRINLSVPEGYTGTDIGYNFELDHYASQEKNKVDGGDPTFTITYHGYSNNDRPYSIESSLANPGLMRTFTMNSDIYPETTTHIDDTNNDQVRFIKERMEALFTVLYEASKNNKAYTIGNDPTDTEHYNKAYAVSNMTARQAIEANFDLDTWACGFIINAFSCPPDLGYSSFYMSFDNTANGAKKLRYDNPWDFDSNFGNRNNFITSADSTSSSGGWGGGSGYDPYYMDRTSNMWLQLLGKMDFFMNVVKAKWNRARENQVFEKMFQMMRVYFKYYDYEARKNFTKWPEIKASDDQVGAYFGGELRDVFKDPKNRLAAQEETINWCSKRVNYLEKKWGTGRPNVNTAA